MVLKGSTRSFREGIERHLPAAVSSFLECEELLAQDRGPRAGDPDPSRLAVTWSGSAGSLGTCLTWALIPAAWNRTSSPLDEPPRTRNRGVASRADVGAGQRLEGLAPGPIDIRILRGDRRDFEVEQAIEPPAHPDHGVDDRTRTKAASTCRSGGGSRSTVPAAPTG